MIRCSDAVCSWRWLVALFACSLLAARCKQPPPPAGAEVKKTAPAQARHPTPPAKAHTSTPPAKAHHPSRPSIDCPLRRHGIDPTRMRPFAEVEKYIAFLERKDRAGWQKPDEVVAALGLAGDETVVDIGAGSGYFAFRLAKALPRGKVIAADVEPEMVRHIHHKAMTDGARNIEARLIKATAPSVPAGVDLVFICDVLHHVPRRAVWLRKIVAAMPAGARLALIEFKEGKLPEGPPEAMKIPRARIVELVSAAGLALAAEHTKLLPYQTFLVFAKP